MRLAYVLRVLAPPVPHITCLYPCRPASKFVPVALVFCFEDALLLMNCTKGINELNLLPSEFLNVVAEVIDEEDLLVGPVVQLWMRTALQEVLLLREVRGVVAVEPLDGFRVCGLVGRKRAIEPLLHALQTVIA